VLADASTLRVEAIVIAALAAVVVLALAWVLHSLVVTMREMRAMAERFREEGLVLLGEMRGTLGQASTDLRRVDELLGTAESITTTVDSASRLAYAAFSNPVIKAMAVGAGTARAARRLRHKEG